MHAQSMRMASGGRRPVINSISRENLDAPVIDMRVVIWHVLNAYLYSYNTALLHRCLTLTCIGVYTV